LKAATLLKADRWLGVPLCFALTLVKAFVGRSPLASSPSPRSLVFVKLAEQGSTVLAYPALVRAVQMVGRENVYFVALDGNQFILNVLGVIPEENVITISQKSGFAFFRSAIPAIRRLRRLKLDAAIDMEFFSRGSAALTFLSGAKRRVGFHRFYGGGLYRGNLMTHRLLYNPRLHTTETFLSLVEALKQQPATLPTFGSQISASEELPQFKPAPEENGKVRELLRGISPTARLILLNPNASDLLPLRRWPNERYVEVARRVLANYTDAAVIFTGAPAEAAVTAGMAQEVGSDRCLSLAGRTTLRELLVLYTLSETLITNDSGPAHFAALTPIHVVTLFGPETPALFSARTPRNTALWAGIACSPCVSAYNNRQSPCKNNVCMQTISTEQVMSELSRIYELRRKNRNSG
jgi:ADP-heptose:LPS heptosyltransferase